MVISWYEMTNPMVRNDWYEMVMVRNVHNSLKEFSDDNFIVARMVKIFFYRIEIIVGKGENADYLNFILLLATLFFNYLAEGSWQQDACLLNSHAPVLPH